MNISILIGSFKYLYQFNLAVSLSKWIYEELSLQKYDDSKLRRSFRKRDYFIFKNLVHMNIDRQVLAKILINSDHKGLRFQRLELCQKITVLKEVNFDICFDNNFLLRYAINNKYFSIVDILVKNGLDVHCDNDHLLKQSVKNNDIKAVDTLLKNGADVHVDDELLLKTAYKENNYKLAKLLLTYGANQTILSDEFINQMNKYRSSTGYDLSLF